MTSMATPSMGPLRTLLQSCSSCFEGIGRGLQRSLPRLSINHDELYDAITKMLDDLDAPLYVVTYVQQQREFRRYKESDPLRQSSPTSHMSEIGILHIYDLLSSRVNGNHPVAQGDQIIYLPYNKTLLHAVHTVSAKGNRWSIAYKAIPIVVNHQTIHNAMTASNKKDQQLIIDLISKNHHEVYDDSNGYTVIDRIASYRCFGLYSNRSTFILLNNN